MPRVWAPSGQVEVSVVRQWRRLVKQGSQAAVAAHEEVVPASGLRQAQQRIRELERALGRKTMEVEILQMAQEEVKKKTLLTALDTVIAAQRLGLKPITTPTYSPQSNGMSEAFVNTLKRDYKRDYVQGAMLWDAQKVLEQVPGWFEGYNQRAPHSALGMLSPRQYRAKMQARLQQRQSLTESL